MMFGNNGNVLRDSGAGLMSNDDKYRQMWRMAEKEWWKEKTD